MSDDASNGLDIGQPEILAADQPNDSAREGLPQDLGVLYVVATPIGNLGDITERARHVLARVDLIAAEDTRHTGRLLAHYGIRANLRSCHDHHEQELAEQLVSLLAGGAHIALVSDAGTPLISDPGFKVVEAARRRGISVVPVPGVNAAICALCAAGLPCDRFLFLGFPPRVQTKRCEWLESLVTEPGTLIFYEAGRRVIATLDDMHSVFGVRRAVVARELTKRFETFLEGELRSLADRLREDPHQQLGEMVILVEGNRGLGNKETESAEQERVMAILSEALPLKQAAVLAARITGGKKNRLYQLGLQKRRGAS